MRWQGLKIEMAFADVLRMAVLVVPLLLLAMSGHWWGESPLQPVLQYVWLPILLAAGVQFGFGFALYRRALSKLARWRFDADTLLALGATAAFSLALWNWRHLAPGSDPDALLAIWRDAAFGASLIAVALLGDMAQRSAQRSAALPRPPVPSGSFVVAPGDFIPCDGVVCDGASEIQDPAGADDVFPILVKAGMPVHAGGRNGDGALTIEARGGNEVISSFSTVMPGEDTLITRVNWAARAMLGLAVVVVTWRLWRDGANRDAVADILRLLAMIAPLGLGLVAAAPNSEVLTAARRLGIEIRDIAILDRLRQIGAIVIGYRGVLVPDRLRVISAYCVDGISGSELIRRVAAVAQLGHDPWGKAVLDFAVGFRMRLKTALNYRVDLGQGIAAWVDRQEIIFGTREYLEERGVDCAPLDEPANLALTQGRRLRWVAEMSPSPRCIGFIAFGAPSVAGAAAAVKNLSRLGFETAWLARNDDAAHRALAKHLKIGTLVSDRPADTALGLAALRRKFGPLLIVIADTVPDGLAEGDVVLPFGRRIMEQLPGSALATTRHDPRLIVDLICLAARQRQLVLTNLAIAFIVAAIVAFLPQFLDFRDDLGSYEVVIVLLLAMSSLSLRAMPTTANEVDEE